MTTNDRDENAAVPEPERPILTINILRIERLVNNARGFATRAAEAEGDDTYDAGYGNGVRDVLRWLAGEEPSGYLRECLAD